MFGESLSGNFQVSYGIKKFKGVVGQQRISTNDLKSTPLPLPPLNEQSRIVEQAKKLLTIIDKVVTKYGEMYDFLLPRFKNILLEKALHGSLVPQLESEPATVCVNDTINDVPFNIPKNWRWCKFSDVLDIQNGDRGKNYPSKDKLTTENTELPFVSAINLEDFKISNRNLLYLKPEQNEKLRAGHIKSGDCLLCIRGSLGKFGFAYKSGGAIASSLAILRQKLDDVILTKYLEIFLQSPLFKEQINLSQNGTAQPNLSAKDLCEFLIPIPPLSEQNRIVNKFMKICTELLSKHQ